MDTHEIGARCEYLMIQWQWHKPKTFIPKTLKKPIYYTFWDIMVIKGWIFLFFSACACNQAGAMLFGKLYYNIFCDGVSIIWVCKFLWSGHTQTQWLTFFICLAYATFVNDDGRTCRWVILMGRRHATLQKIQSDLSQNRNLCKRVSIPIVMFILSDNDTTFNNDTLYKSFVR